MNRCKATALNVLKRNHRKLETIQKSAPEGWIRASPQCNNGSRDSIQLGLAALSYLAQIHLRIEHILRFCNPCYKTAGILRWSTKSAEILDGNKRVVFYLSSIISKQAYRCYCSMLVTMPVHRSMGFAGTQLIWLKPRQPWTAACVELE